VHTAAEAIIADEVPPGCGVHGAYLSATVRPMLRLFAAADAAALLPVGVEGYRGSRQRVVLEVRRRLLQEPCHLRLPEAASLVELWNREKGKWIRWVSISFFSG
jgi:hypothetical protein